MIDGDEEQQPEERGGTALVMERAPTSSENPLVSPYPARSQPTMTMTHTNVLTERPKPRHGLGLSLPPDALLWGSGVPITLDNKRV